MTRRESHLDPAFRRLTGLHISHHQLSMDQTEFGITGLLGSQWVVAVFTTVASCRHCSYSWIESVNAGSTLTEGARLLSIVDEGRSDFSSPNDHCPPQEQLKHYSIVFVTDLGIATLEYRNVMYDDDVDCGGDGDIDLAVYDSAGRELFSSREQFWDESVAAWDEDYWLL